MSEVGQWFLGIMGSLTMIGLGGAGFLHGRLNKMEMECQAGIEHVRGELSKSTEDRHRQYELVLERLREIPTRPEIERSSVAMETRIMAAIRKNGNGSS